MANPASSSTVSDRGAIAMHAGDARFQVGDPGRYLAPGLFQALLEVLQVYGIDHAYGYDVVLTDHYTGESGRVTGFDTRLPGVVIPDTGPRDLGDFISDTGHLAITEMSICVEPDVCDQCRWIHIGEAFSIVAAGGLLNATGSQPHVRFETHIESVREQATTTLRRAA